MGEPWPSVPLGELLIKSRETTQIDPERMYKEVTVRLWGNGVVLRRLAAGTEIAAGRRAVARAGEFILSRIDARNGAFGIVPGSLDGAVVSNDFPSFRPVETRLDTAYLAWLSKTQTFVDLCRQASEGTTNRVRLKEDLFLRTEIPLPPIEEQRRIVARIEAIAEKVEEAQRLRKAAEEQGKQLVARTLRLRPADASTWTDGTVADVVTNVDAGWSPQCLDRSANSSEWGVLKTTSVQWCEFRAAENKALPADLEPRGEYGVVKGDVLVTRAGPRHRVGVVAAVQADNPRLMLSDKIIRLRVDPSRILPRFLELALASQPAQEHFFHRKTGLADAQVNISQAILKAAPIAYPSITEQAEIISRHDTERERAQLLALAQSEVDRELTAILPAVLDRAFQGDL